MREVVQVVVWFAIVTMFGLGVIWSRGHPPRQCRRRDGGVGHVPPPPPAVPSSRRHARLAAPKDLRKVDAAFSASTNEASGGTAGLVFLSLSSQITHAVVRSRVVRRRTARRCVSACARVAKRDALRISTSTGSPDRLKCTMRFPISVAYSIGFRRWYSTESTSASGSYRSAIATFLRAVLLAILAKASRVERDDDPMSFLSAVHDAEDVCGVERDLCDAERRSRAVDEFWMLH